MQQSREDIREFPDEQKSSIKEGGALKTGEQINTSMRRDPKKIHTDKEIAYQSVPLKETSKLQV